MPGVGEFGIDGDVDIASLFSSSSLLKTANKRTMNKKGCTTLGSRCDKLAYRHVIDITWFSIFDLTLNTSFLMTVFLVSGTSKAIAASGSLP